MHKKPRGTSVREKRPHPFLTGFACAIVLLFCTRAELAGRNLLAATPASLAEQPPSFVEATSYGGVHHYPIPISLNKTAPSIGNGTVSGVLHVYLKAVRFADNHLRVKGFAVFDFIELPAHWFEGVEPAVQELIRKNPVMTIPEMRTLRLAIRANAQGWQREISVETASNACEKIKDLTDYEACYRQRNRAEGSNRFPDISFDLGPTLDMDFDLVVLGSNRAVSLRPMLHGASDQKVEGPGSPPQVWHLVHAPAGLPNIARTVGWYIDFHSRIGFQGTILYVRATDVPAFNADPGLQALVRSGRLRMVVWSDIPYREDWILAYKYDQLVVINHGVLSLFGENALVWSADLDEFLTIRQPGATIADMLANGCLAVAAEHRCFHVERRSMFLRPEGGGLAEEEPSLWLQEGPHPLLRYKYWSETHMGAGPAYPKALVSPDAAGSLTCHMSSVCAGVDEIADGSSTDKLASSCSQRLPCMAVPPSCAIVAHVVNQHVARVRPRNTTAFDPSNFWMLQDR